MDLRGSSGKTAVAAPKQLTTVFLNDSAANDCENGLSEVPGKGKDFFFCRRFHVAVSMVDLSSTKLRMLWKSMGSGWFSKSMSACLLLGKTIRHQRIEEKPILGENHVRLDVHLWESCHQVCWLKF